MKLHLKSNTNLLVVLAILVAAHIILSRFLSINTPILKIGFSFVAIFVAAYFYGPVAGAAVGALGDFLGAILFPIGPYFPGFTVNCALTGILFGVLLHKEQTVPRILCAALINQLVIGLLINTYWISFLYGAPYLETMGPRVVQALILIPVEFVTMLIMSKALLPRLRKAGVA